VQVLGKEIAGSLIVTQGEARHVREEDYVLQIVERAIRGQVRLYRIFLKKQSI